MSNIIGNSIESSACEQRTDHHSEKVENKIKEVVVELDSAILDQGDTL